MIADLDIEERVPLAPRTTLELGGAARFYLRATDEATVRDGLRWADARGLPVGILGGGSNLVVPDEGFAGLVVEMALSGVERVDDGSGLAHVTAAAGEDWGGLVDRAVADGLAGIECLAGIPGRVGASPIQNIGAYGQDVSETITSVRLLERSSGETVDRPAAECGFGYRDSHFKREPTRFVVLAVTFALRPGGPPAVRYAELERALEDVAAPDLATVRSTVLRLRRSKSMVIDEGDPNRRSAGSFFTNPIVEEAAADEVGRRAVAAGVVASAGEVPRWPQPGGRVKLAAGWLIERAGVAKGTRAGAVGISTQHALALVHHGGGTTAALLAFAQTVRDAVRTRFDVELEQEPRIFGQTG